MPAPAVPDGCEGVDAAAGDAPAVWFGEDRCRLAAELHELDVFWLEEPLPGSDLRGLASLRETSGMRIAGGEMARTLDELLAYLEADAFDVYQPDVVLAAGMSRVRLVAELALASRPTYSTAQPRALKRGSTKVQPPMFCDSSWAHTHSRAERYRLTAAFKASAGHG